MDLLKIMSKPANEQLPQPMGHGAIVHTEENFEPLTSTIAQAIYSFTLMRRTCRTSCCFLEWYKDFPASL